MGSEVGSTKDVGYEIGVSRTLGFRLEEVWALLVSPDGLALWLGSVTELGTEKGARYETLEGTTGEIRSFHPLDRIRLTWRPVDWDHDTTVQVALQDTGDRTLLRFHQEWLADGAERARQREHWKSVMAAVETALRA